MRSAAEQERDEEARQLVRKGACQLDKKQPGWAEMIDLEMLDMHSCSYCVLGQMGTQLLSEADEAPWRAPYGRMLRKLFGRTYSDERVKGNPFEPHAAVGAGLAYDDEWVRQIECRRSV